MSEKVVIRGVGVDNVTLADAAEICRGFVNAPGDVARAVFTPNSEIIQACVENEELYATINAADLVTPVRLFSVACACLVPICVYYDTAIALFWKTRKKSDTKKR